MNPTIRTPRSRGLLLGVLTTALIAALPVLAPPASAAAPVVVNGASSDRWLESQSVPKDTNGERLHATIVVRHDLGTTLTGLAIDDDWDGTDNTLTVAPEGGGTATTLPSGASNYSTIRYSWVPPNPPGFSCGVFSGTRRVNNTLRLRGVLSDGQRTGVITTNVHAVENGQCLGATDYPFMFNQSQTASQVVPGQTVTFTFQGDDPDGSGSNDRLDKLRWRVRRLSDGAIVQGPVNVGGLSDNTNINLTVGFPDRGRFVVEAELGGEDDNFGAFENGGRFFRIGAVDVNSAASAHAVTLTRSAPVVNDGASATVTAAFTDPDAADGGRAQMIRWDGDGNGTFERRELADQESTGLTSAQLQQSVTTAAGSCADRTVSAEITDNGALNGADAIRRSATSTTTIVVNCAPIAHGQVRATDEDTALAITLTGSDGDGDALTYVIVSGPAHGSVTGGTGANRTYTPAADYHGPDSFTFRSTDVHGRQSAPATVNLTVNPVNDPPVAADQAVSTSEDTPIVIDLAGAVSDVDGDTLTVAVATPATHGTAAMTGPFELTYTPDADFNGIDAFQYSVDDGNGGTDTAVVDVTVDPTDDVPEAADQAVTTAEDTPVSLVLGPTHDADGEALTYALVSPAANGSVVIAGNQATYTPDADVHGTDSFTFSATDGNSAPIGTVTVTVTPVNDAPVATDQSVSTDEDVAVPISLTATDVDGDEITFTVAGAPFHGTITMSSPTTAVYTPDPDYFGPDAFTVVADDGNGGTDTATVSIEVRPVNDAPVAGDQSVVTDEDTAVGVVLTGSDVDGDDLAFAVTTAPQHGVLSGTAPNLVYTPTLNYFGPDAFAFSVDDGNGGTASAIVEITVQPVNDAPVAVPQGVETDEDTPVTIALEGLDVDGDDLAVAIASGPSHGTLDTAVGTTVEYTPAPDFHGDDAFTFTVTDPDGLSDTATVLVSVGAVNDNPVAHDQEVATDEDTPLVVSLTATDVDGDPLAYAVEVGPQHGTVQVDGTTVIYTPALNFHGDDAFVFRVEDGESVDYGTVDITVRPVNDAPDALPASVSVPEDTATPIELDGSDADGDALTFTVVSLPAHGTLSGTAPNLVYTPATDYTGPDSFQFRVTDPSGAGDTATVTIQVVAAPMLATTLVADPAFVHALNPLYVRLDTLSATLTETATGAPVVGATVVFSVDGSVVCAATTDAQGRAACGSAQRIPAILVGLGYQASYAGDADRLPSSASGRLVTIEGVSL